MRSKIDIDNQFEITQNHLKLKFQYDSIQWKG